MSTAQFSSNSIVTETVVAFLKCVPPFQFLPSFELSALAKCMALEYFPKDTLILGSGQAASVGKCKHSSRHSGRQSRVATLGCGLQDDHQPSRSMRSLHQNLLDIGSAAGAADDACERVAVEFSLL